MPNYFANLFGALLGADRRIEAQLDQLITGQTKMTQALTDLQTEFASFTASVSAEIAAAVAAITAASANSSGSVAAADVETVVGNLKSLQSTVDAATVKFAPPTPAPTA
jgi:hypothetical protein